MAAYAAVTAAMFFPVVAHLNRIPHDPGDPLFNTWILWWNATVVPFTTAWWNGPAFWPIQGSLSFSEHLAGLSLITTPLIWMGISPATAYSIVFVLSWPLSACAAHLLAYRLTGRHDAGFVAGLIFGFSPYRVAQTAHIQVLISWWMPLALVALHEAVATHDTRRRAGALAIFAGCWLLQALSNGYLLFYFSTFLVFWLAWFATRRGARLAGLLILIAWAAAAAAIVPVLLEYRAVHAQWGLHRPFQEIVGFSGDALSFFKGSSLSGLWRFSPIGGLEQELYPGIVALLMLVTWVALAIRQAWTGRKHGRIFWILVAVAAVYGAAAALTLSIGPWSLQLGPLSVGGTRFRKPLTVSLLLLLAAMLVSPGGMAAIRSRSVLLFSVLATGVCALMCLGPVARLGGTTFLEYPPYSWLVGLPGFNALRVPARFAAVATLALAMAAAVGFARFVPRRARVLSTALLLALLADSWPRPMPMMDLPETYRLPEIAQHAAILELPGGTVLGDIAAMVRGMTHRRPVVNGYSGHIPPPYVVLGTALREDDLSVLAALATYGPICLVVDRRSGGPALEKEVMENAARHVGGDGPFAFYMLDARQPPPMPVGERIDLRQVIAPTARRLDTRLFDGRLDTVWVTRGPQRGGESFAIPLNAPTELSGVEMDLAEKIIDYPRLLQLETSMDGKMWEVAWRGPTAALAYRALMADPKNLRLTVTFPRRVVQRIRLRQLGRSSRASWSIAELHLLR